MAVAPIDMSLRLWSDDVELGPVMRRLGLVPGIIHARGKPVPGGRSRTRIAPRHFASVASQRGTNDADVDRWMQSLLGIVERDEHLVVLITSGRIEATFWIAMLGSAPLPMPHIPQQRVDDAASLGMVIFMENYTTLDDGNPAREWLPERPAVAPVRGMSA